MRNAWHIDLDIVANLSKKQGCELKTTPVPRNEQDQMQLPRFVQEGNVNNHLRDRLGYGWIRITEMSAVTADIIRTGILLSYTRA